MSSIAPTSSHGFSSVGYLVKVISRAVSLVNSPSRPAHILSFSPSGSSSDSPYGINLCVDLSKFHLQQVPNSVSSILSQMARTHHMVFRLRLAKNANFSIATASRVASLPQHEPLSFKDAHKYLIWHNVMHEKIRALHSNQTWSLVPSHQSMNVMGNRWV